MTCIVGIAHEGIVYMGGERGVSNGDILVPALKSKIIQVDNFLVGYSGTGFGVGQLATLAEYPQSDENLDMELRTLFAKSMRKLIRKYGGIENGSHDLLVGGYGRIFEVYTDDWGIVELSETAVGSGSSYAIGSLYSTQDKEPLYRVHEALNASIQYSPTCAGPIDILQV